MLFYNEYENRVYEITRLKSLKENNRRYVSGRVYTPNNDPDLETVTWPSMVSESLEPLLQIAKDNLRFKLMINQEYGSVMRAFLKRDWEILIKSVESNFPLAFDEVMDTDLIKFPEGY